LFPFLRIFQLVKRQSLRALVFIVDERQNGNTRLPVAVRPSGCRLSFQLTSGSQRSCCLVFPDMTVRFQEMTDRNLRVMGRKMFMNLQHLGQRPYSFDKSTRGAWIPQPPSFALSVPLPSLFLSSICSLFSGIARCSIA